MAQVNFRVDDQVKHEADELFDHLGLSLSAAITIFLKQSISHRGFPFSICELPRERLPPDLYYACPPVVRAERPVEDEGRAKRRAALQALSGSWKDARSTQEIIRDIEGHRTRGRSVVL